MEYYLELVNSTRGISAVPSNSEDTSSPLAIKRVKSSLMELDIISSICTLFIILTKRDINIQELMLVY